MYLPEIGCHSCLLDDFQSSKIAPMSKARDRQVGGDHYGPENKVQAIDLCLDQNIPFCEGSAIKYLVRWRKKGGLQDLHKAQHYIQMLIDHEEANEAIPGDTDGSASPGD